MKITKGIVFTIMYFLTSLMPLVSSVLGLAKNSRAGSESGPKILDRTALLLAVFLGPFSMLHPVFADESCTSCTSKKRQDCGITCQNQPSREQFDACSDACVLKSCQKVCEQSGLPREVQLGNPHARCQRCIQEHEQTECFQQCSAKTYNVSPCIKKCARQACGDICEVTDSPALDDPQRDQRECEQCKITAKLSCAEASECRPGTPGSVACQVNCINARCRAKCDFEN